MHVRMLLGIAAALIIATTAAAQGELKIGYVNAEKVISEAPQGKAALEKLEAEFSPRDKKIVEMQSRLKDMALDMEKNGLLMKESERRTKEYEIANLKRDLRRATQEFNEDYNLRRNEELAALQKIVQKTVLDLVKQENYDLVVNEGVLYAGPKVDITEKVLKRLGKK